MGRDGQQFHCTVRIIDISVLVIGRDTHGIPFKYFELGRLKYDIGIAAKDVNDFLSGMGMKLAPVGFGMRFAMHQNHADIRVHAARSEHIEEHVFVVRVVRLLPVFFAQDERVDVKFFRQQFGHLHADRVGNGGQDTQGRVADIAFKLTDDRRAETGLFGQIPNGRLRCLPVRLNLFSDIEHALLSSSSGTSRMKIA